MKKRILLTGGMGYVGGRLARHLCELEKYTVSIGTRDINAILPRTLRKCSLVCTDWKNLNSLEKATKNIDVIIHLAAMNEVDAIKHPDLAMEQTSDTTLNLLNAAVKNNVDLFINISTARVYKNPFSGYVDEFSEVDPDHPYAIAHRHAEMHVEQADKSKKIRGLNLRLSNCFGAPISPDVRRWTLLMNDLCRKVVSSKEIVLLSPGLQKRDFITLEDASRAITHIMEVDKNLMIENVFNVGSGWTPSILEIAQLISSRCKEKFNFQPKVIAPDPTPADISNELTYSNKRLLNTGFNLVNDNIKEIDNLLDFCQLNFADKRDSSNDT